METARRSLPLRLRPSITVVLVEVDSVTNVPAKLCQSRGEAGVTYLSVCATTATHIIMVNKKKETKRLERALPPIPDKKKTITDSKMDSTSSRVKDVNKTDSSEANVTARYVGEVMQSAVGLVTGAISYPKGVIVESARPVYWVSDDKITTARVNLELTIRNIIAELVGVVSVTSAPPTSFLFHLEAGIIQFVCVTLVQLEQTYRLSGDQCICTNLFLTCTS